MSTTPNDRAGDKDSEDTSEHPSGPTSDSGSPSQTRSGIFDNGFEAYRTVTDDDYRALFASGLVVLDTNVLLDLYRYHPETRQELLNVLDKLSERLWIPNQVMAEFWARRESVLEDASDITDTVVALNRLSEQYIGRVREWTNRAGLREEATDSLVAISRSAFDATIKKIRSLADDKALKMAEDTAKDPVLIRLKSILQDRVGNPLTVERKRTAINQEAPQRFADRRPPGYMDANKKNGDPAGDYLIWIELLQEAARLKANVLFVTGDTKEDWWRQERGQAKGPHPQLVEEIWNVAGVCLFMLRPASLLKHAGDLLQVKVSPESVQDAQRITATVTTNWRVTNLETEIAEKLRVTLGEQAVSLSERFRTDAGQLLEADVIVRLPGKVPVVFEIKYVANRKSKRNSIADGFQHLARTLNNISGLGVLVLILSDAASNGEVEEFSREAEDVAAYYTASFSIYVARESAFLAEPANTFTDRIIPHDLPSE